jgi:hypothetical protein
MMAANETTELQIPRGWIPAGTCIDIVAIYDFDRGRWEAFTPAFSVAGEGESVEDAVDQMMTLLLGYFEACARDGMTFEQAHRAMGWRWAAAAVRAAARAWLHHRRRRNAVQRLRRSPVLPAH